jgi:glutamine cyclotransferase
MDENFAVQKKLPVTIEGRRVSFLNELEFIDGRVWANVYTTDSIVIINPRNGQVEGLVDCTGLLPKKLYKPSTDVLNGIAYDEKTGKIYLTGKNWPKLYEVKLVEKN